MIKKFLHLSDLHFRPNWPEEVDLVSKKFFHDLEESWSGGLDSCILLFSGDVVFAAADRAQYDAFLESFGAKLDAIGITADRRIVIPGNHDVSRDFVKNKLILHNGALAELKSERDFNENLTSLSEDIFKGKFTNYLEFENAFSTHTNSNNNLGGSGLNIGDSLGVYCLNTAICSSAGVQDSRGRTIEDHGKLMIDTRSIHQWLSAEKLNHRILMMHHPLDWLAPWAKAELERIIESDFDLVVSGHVHEQSAVFHQRYSRRSIACSAPPLFTRKSESLGYSLINLDTESGNIEINYRQWSPARKFVLGTNFSGNDTGRVQFLSGVAKETLLDTYTPPKVSRDKPTLDILKAELEEATTCFASMKNLWVNRDLAISPENSRDHYDAILIQPEKLLDQEKCAVVRAPTQFGLTSLGRFLALEYFKSRPGQLAVYIDSEKLPAHETGLRQTIEDRCRELGSAFNQVSFLILDNWVCDKRSQRKIKGLLSILPDAKIIILHGVDDAEQIGENMSYHDDLDLEVFYLWSLNRNRIRELVSKYLEHNEVLDEERVTAKIIEDIDSLNIHRTPHNCLTLLKIAEQAYDDSPVNRTEMIGRILYLLFYEFDKIPRYATRPDLKDCEYALGYFCESLIRDCKTSFSKSEFYRKVQDYCDKMLIDLDIEVLFGFLAVERIFVRKGSNFEFRFSYWLYYFAAHRMHQDVGFSQFILGDERYTVFPEIIEFYTGIDRRREDAVTQLSADLKRMNADFLTRTGISDALNPFDNARWSPSEEAIEAIQKEIHTSVASSTLPQDIKDQFADKQYDRSRPYNQAVSAFIKESSLRQMVQAMRGASRALRNSDHVSPTMKEELLNEVITCWMRVTQILVLVSPLLARDGNAAYEGLGFYLTKDFDSYPEEGEKWAALMSAIPSNVINWYQQDIFSRRMGPLLKGFLKTSKSSLRNHLVRYLLVLHRPIGWEKELNNFVLQEDKNSFYLMDIFQVLEGEHQYGLSSEKNKSELRRLSATAIARHDRGVKRPNLALLKQAEEALDNAAK